MKNNTILFLIGVLVGMTSMFAPALLIRFPQKIENEKVVRCEEKGGRYSLFYSDYLEQYVDECEIKAINIENYLL